MDRYIVFIDKHMFDMSIYPDRANEVNMYAGTFEPPISSMNKAMAILEFKSVQMPKSLKYAIRQRCQEIRHGTKNQHNTK